MSPKTFAKWTAGTLLLAAVATLLAQPKRNTDNIPPGRTVLRYWEKWSGNEGEHMKKIVDDFNRTVGAEKNIWVTYISMSQVDQKTLVSTAAGDPPEIAGLWAPQIAQFGAMGALEPLGPYAAAAGISSTAYKPVFWDMCTFEDNLYGLPSTPTLLVLHYNKLLFAKAADKLRAAGLDPTRAPRTTAELDRYAEVLDEWEGTPGQGQLRVAGYMPNEPGWPLSSNPLWFGSKIYDEKTRKVSLTDPATVASFEWLVGYSKRLGVDRIRRFKAGLATNFDSPQSPFFAQSVAMVQDGVWKANYISIHAPHLANPENLPPAQIAAMTRQQRRDYIGWGMAAVPSGSPALTDMSFASSDMLCIPRSAKHKKEAFEFIAYVNRQDVMEKIVSLHCKNTPLKAESANYIQNHPNPYIEEFERLANSPGVTAIPKLPVWPEIAAELTVLCENILLGRGTTAELLPAAEKRCQAVVDRYFERQALRLGRPPQHTAEAR